MNPITSKKLAQPLTTGLPLWAVLLIGIALEGCAVNDKKEGAMMHDTTNRSVENRAQSAAPLGYPYSPEELWERLVEVIKTPPDELTYRKFGAIFGLEFDEDKMLWYGDRKVGKYFLVSKRAIENIESFPFEWISLSQGDPDTYTKPPRRLITFGLDLFGFKHNQQSPFSLSAKYCVKPRRSNIEALGYVYNKLESTSMPRPDRYGNIPQIPYSQVIMIDDVDPQTSVAHKQVVLKVLANGCLVGISYSNHHKY